MTTPQNKVVFINNTFRRNEYEPYIVYMDSAYYIKEGQGNDNIINEITEKQVARLLDLAQQVDELELKALDIMIL